MACDDGDSSVEDDDNEIEDLLREATNSYLQQGDEIPPILWDEARYYRTRAIQNARQRALVSRNRRPAKQTLPRSLNYETDVCRALTKYGIAYPRNLEEVACSLLDCQHHRDATRALRILFMKLLFGTGSRVNNANAQIVLEDVLNFYDLIHMRSAFLNAMHKHFKDEL